jgi:very-short-patch-repair endonuclease
MARKLTKTMRREEFLKKQGYNLITIWEDDYIKQMKKK